MLIIIFYVFLHQYVEFFKTLSITHTSSQREFRGIYTYMHMYTQIYAHIYFLIQNESVQ